MDKAYITRARQQIKMKDVASALGMSVSTVSRVLSHPELVTPDRRKLVEEAVARLNYRPNLTARNLRTRASRVVLVIFPQLSPFFLDMFRGVERAAGETGYTALMGHSGHDPRREEMFLEQVLSRRADGVILVAASDTSVLAERRRATPPVVALLEAIRGQNFPTVRVNNRAGAQAATDHLIGLGHRRIAYIGGPPHMTMAQYRTLGFREAIEAAGLDPAHCPMIDGDFSIASGEAATERLLAHDPRPTAIFAANDEMAVGAMQALKRAGIAIGTGMSVIGFDDQRMASVYEPQLTTVHVPMVELGYRAMLLLRSAIEKGDTVQEHVILPTRIVVRATTAPPASA